MKVWIVRGAIVVVILSAVLSALYTKYYPKKHSKYYPNGQIFEKTTLINGVKNGPAVTYYANGAIRSEDNYKNGLLDGEIKRYLENGVYFSVNTFKNGSMEGMGVFYYPTGIVRDRQMFKNNIPDGLLQSYYEDGALHAEIEFLQGKFHGTSKTYSKNGKLLNFGNFKDGIKQGAYRKYSESGFLTMNVQYVNDELSGINEWYYESGEPKIIATYEKGKLQGPMQKFNAIGMLESYDEYKYENGNETKNGISKEYYSSQPFTKESGVDAVPQFRSDAQVPVRWLKTWKSDTLDGPVKLFAKDGSVLAEFSYHQKHITGQSKIKFDEAFNKVELDSTEEELLFSDLMGLLFVFEDFDQIEQLANKFRVGKGRLSSFVPMLEKMYEGLSDGFEEINCKNETPYLGILNRWIGKYPQSITARALLVYTYTQIAWNYRGGGYASTISEEGAKKFKDFLEKALEAGSEAMSLSNQDPALYDAMITAGLGASLPKEAIYVFLEAGRNVDPDYDTLYRSMSSVLLPRWQGRAGELEGFVDWVLSISRERTGFIQYAVLYSGLRSYVGNDDVRKYKYDWEKLKKGFIELLAAYPASFYYLNNYAFFATEAGDKELSKALFEKIGNRWDSVSKEIWVEKTFFDERKKWAYGQKPAVPDKSTAALNSGNLAGANTIAQTDDDLNAKDHAGRSPLMIAIIDNNISGALLLIEKGADLSLTDKDKRSAIHFAAQNQSSKLFDRLISRGVAVNGSDSWGYGPLHYAARSGYESHIRRLLTIKNVNVNGRTNTGLAALHFTARAGYIDATNELLKSSLIDVNLQNDKGETPLHLAAQKGFKELAGILLAHAADKTIKDAQGKTAADYALENRYSELAVLLK